MIWLVRTAGALVSAAFVVATIFVPFSPLTISAEPSIERSISVDPRPLEVVCPGSLYQLGGEDGTDVDSIEALGDANFYLIEDGVATPFRASQPAIFSSSSEGQSARDLSGYQWQEIDQSRISGSVSLTCKKPATEAVLLGGKTSLGFESLLIVHNPDVLSTILDLRFFDSQDQVDESISLAPDETKVINLARYVNTDQAVGVRINSQGGRFAAWIQSKSNSGITPTGADISAHNQLQSNPALIIRAQSEELPTEFRVPEVYALVTESLSTTVSISSLDGGFGDAFRVDLQPGVNSIPMPDLQPGSYQVSIEAENALLSSHSTNPLAPDFSIGQSEAGVSGDIQMVALIDGIVEVSSFEETVVSMTVIRNGLAEVATIDLLTGRNVLSAEVEFGDQIEISGENLLIRVSNEETQYQATDNSNLGSDLSITVR